MLIFLHAYDCSSFKRGIFPTPGYDVGAEFGHQMICGCILPTDRWAHVGWVEGGVPLLVAVRVSVRAWHR